MQIPPEPEQMTWAHRFSAMGIGSIAALFALGKSPPKTHQEGMIRFFAGAVFAFTCTGFLLRTFGFAIYIDSVLAGGMVCGCIGWWVIGALVGAGESGLISDVVTRWIRGTGPKIQ